MPGKKYNNIGNIMLKKAMQIVRIDEINVETKYFLPLPYENFAVITIKGIVININNGDISMKRKKYSTGSVRIQA